jgi:hypothetical protein
MTCPTAIAATVLNTIEGEVSSPSSLSTDQLVSAVVSSFSKIRDAMPYVFELRKRFADAPRGAANIAGCQTWKEFCQKHLHRTPRAVQLAFHDMQAIACEHCGEMVESKNRLRKHINKTHPETRPDPPPYIQPKPGTDATDDVPQQPPAPCGELPNHDEKAALPTVVDVANAIRGHYGWISEGGYVDEPKPHEEWSQYLRWYSRSRVRVQGLQVVPTRSAQANADREHFFLELTKELKGEWTPLIEENEPHAYIKATTRVSPPQPAQEANLTNVQSTSRIQLQQIISNLTDKESHVVLKIVKDILRDLRTAGLGAA